MIIIPFKLILQKKNQNVILFFYLLELALLITKTTPLPVIYLVVASSSVLEPAGGMQPRPVGRWSAWSQST